MRQVTAGYVKASVAAQQRAYLDRVTKLEEAEAAKQPQHEGWMTMLPDVKVLCMLLIAECIPKCKMCCVL